MGLRDDTLRNGAPRIDEAGVRDPRNRNQRTRGQESPRYATRRYAEARERDESDDDTVRSAHECQPRYSAGNSFMSARSFAQGDQNEERIERRFHAARAVFDGAWRERIRRPRSEARQPGTRRLGDPAGEEQEREHVRDSVDDDGVERDPMSAEQGTHCSVKERKQWRRRTEDAFAGVVHEASSLGDIPRVPKREIGIVDDIPGPVAKTERDYCEYAEDDGEPVQRIGLASRSDHGSFPTRRHRGADAGGMPWRACDRRRHTSRSTRRDDVVHSRRGPTAIGRDRNAVDTWYGQSDQKMCTTRNSPRKDRTALTDSQLD